MVFKKKYRDIIDSKRETKKIMAYFGYKRISSLAWLYNTEKKTIPIKEAYMLAEYLGVKIQDVFEFKRK